MISCMRKGLAKIYGMGILMMLLTACGTQTEYTNALPKGASLVVSADLMSMAGKSGWNGESTQTWEKKMGEILQGGLSEEASAMARDLIRNPKESGLSFAHKIYLFSTPHANAYGWLAKVESERKVKNDMPMGRAISHNSIGRDIKVLMVSTMRVVYLK